MLITLLPTYPLTRFHPPSHFPRPRATKLNSMRFILVSGLSGSGKSTALRALDDAGFFVTDNLPPQMWLEHFRLARNKGVDKLAVCTDARTHLFFDDLELCLDALYAETPIQLLFLEASNDVLLSRYNLTRRAHPLGELSLFMDFRREHEILAPLRERADIVLDTTHLGTAELLERVRTLLVLESEFHLGVSSFGFKHAPPRDADLVLDVRGMPNPHYVPGLKPRTGLDEDVAAYVFREPRAEGREQKAENLASSVAVLEAPVSTLKTGAQDVDPEKFYAGLRDFVRSSAELARASGRHSYTVAIGCTGGQHRSVAVAERLARELGDLDARVTDHRDIGKGER